MSSTLERQLDSAVEEWIEYWERGPTRLCWTKLPPQVGDLAPDLELQASSGHSVHLRSFWSDRPALLLFWRHYGCGCGIERANRLQQEYADYISAGANLVVIGQGEPERATAYAQQYNLPCPVLCDPDLHAYQAYGLLEGKPSQIAYGEGALTFIRLDSEARMRYAKERRAAGRPPVDDPFQLPGEFVVDRDGRIGLAYRYQYCDNYADPAVLLTAIREAVGEEERAK